MQRPSRLGHLLLSLMLPLSCCGAAAAGLTAPAPPLLAFVRGSLADAVRPGGPLLSVVVSGGRPARRQPGEPCLAFSAEATAALPPATLRVLRAAWQPFCSTVEALRGRPLFRLELGVLPAGSCALAVFHASAGQVLLSQQTLAALAGSSLAPALRLAGGAAAAVEQLLRSVAQAGARLSLRELGGLVGAVLASTSALAGTSALVAAPVPLWFCVLCPIVLGLLSPLAINAAIGEAANLACEALSLSDEECVELWLGALALGLVLSLLSAWPIAKVCRLAQCAHPNGTVSTASVAVL